MSTDSKESVAAKGARGAAGYIRVSGRAQRDGDGPERQRQAIETYCRRHRLRLREVFQDTYTGTTTERPGFAAMVAMLKSEDVRVIVIERLDRFARELGVQLALLGVLEAEGVSLIEAATGRDVTADMAGDPMARALVSIQGVFHQVEKELLVRKLAAARRRIREAVGRCEGVKPFPATEAERATVRRARELRRKKPHKRRRSLREVAAILDAEGHGSRSRGAWHPGSLRRILSRVVKLAGQQRS